MGEVRETNRGETFWKLSVVLERRPSEWAGDRVRRAGLGPAGTAGRPGEADRERCPLGGIRPSLMEHHQRDPTHQRHDGPARARPSGWNGAEELLVSSVSLRGVVSC